MFFAHPSAAQIPFNEAFEIERRNVIERDRQVALVHRIDGFVEASNDVVLVLSQDVKTVIHMLQLNLRKIS